MLGKTLNFADRYIIHRVYNLTIFLLLLILSARAGYADEKPNGISTFSNLMESLQSGHRVQIVIRYSLCTMQSDQGTRPGPNVIGGMDLSPFEYFSQGSVNNSKAYVASSHTLPISHPRYGIVLNMVKVRLYEDDSVEITARYLDPKDYRVVMEEIFTTTIDNGSNNGGALLYTNYCDD